MRRWRKWGKFEKAEKWQQVEKMWVRENRKIGNGDREMGKCRNGENRETTENGDMWKLGKIERIEDNRDDGNMENRQMGKIEKMGK